LRTTIVIPLYPLALAGSAAISKLCLEVESENFILLTQQIAGVDRKNLGKEICNLSHARIEILAALDFIVSGI
jgi:toxin CcdB